MVNYYLNMLFLHLPLYTHAVLSKMHTDCIFVCAFKDSGNEHPVIKSTKAQASANEQPTEVIVKKSKNNTQCGKLKFSHLFILSFMNLYNIGYFRIGFIQRKYYKPAGKYTFRSGLTQEDIVCSHANDNVARIYEVQESIVAYPEAEFRLFPENPLHMGYFLDNIEDSEYYNIQIVPCTYHSYNLL